VTIPCTSKISGAAMNGVGSVVPAGGSARMWMGANVSEAPHARVVPPVSAPASSRAPLPEPQPAAANRSSAIACFTAHRMRRAPGDHNGTPVLSRHGADDP
jgi:hypothetical protein